MKTGLVLEGGAMRGLFTAGILDVLMENNIIFDGMVGVSAGAAFGCNFKSRQIGRSIRYNLKYCKDPRYCSLRSLIKTGDLYGKELCYYEIPQKYDIFDFDTFTENPMEFYVVCTDVDTGKPVYHKMKTGKGMEMEWMRASASMPMVSQPVKIGSRRFLDGGISDSIPLKFMEHQGYERNVVILTQPKGYVKHNNKAFPLIKKILKHMPQIATAMEQRADKYNKSLRYLKKLEADGKILIIYPPQKLEAGHIEHDPEIIQRTYEIGRQTGEQELQRIQKFLQQAKQSI